MAKLLRINLDTKKYKLEDMPAAYANLGGRGLTSKIVSEEVPPKANPLGKDNKLVIAAGILAATPAPNSGRLSVGAKSPLTGTIKEANSGGSAAQKLARLGIQWLTRRLLRGLPGPSPPSLKPFAEKGSAGGVRGVSFHVCGQLEDLGDRQNWRRVTGWSIRAGGGRGGLAC